MEGMIIGWALMFVGFLFVGSLMGIIATVNQKRNQRYYESEILSISKRLRRLEEKAEPAEPIKPRAEARPVEVMPTPTTCEPYPLREPVAPVPPVAPHKEVHIQPPPPKPPQPLLIERLESAPASESGQREWWANFEQRVGKRWMTWAGALVLILSAGFFVKYAIDNQWISPAVRDVIGMAFGAVIAGLGVRFIRKEMNALGQGLIGGGLAILYVSLYAAYGFHGWLPQSAAFVGMIIVSAAGIALAVHFDAMPISVLAILGGFITPVVVSTGRDERDILFAYLLLLDLTVLGVSWFKRWRMLDVIAFVGTAILFIGWFSRFYVPAAMVPAMLWLGVFYLIFLILPFVNHMRTQTPITVERFGMALGNATFGCALAWQILRATHPHALGYCVMGMSAAYLAFGILSRVRIPEDEKSAFSFFALSITCFTISIPLHFGLNGITLCWAAEVPVLVYFGYRYKYWPVRLGGFLIFVVTILRFFARHWPLHEQKFTLFMNVQFGIAMWVVAAGAAFAIIHHWQKKESAPLDRALKITSAITAGFLAVLATHAELGQWFFDRFGERWTERCSTVVVWAVGLAAFEAASQFTRGRAIRVAAKVALLVAVCFAIRMYAHDIPDRYEWFLNPRFASAMAVVLVSFAGAIALFLARGVGADGERSRIGRRFVEAAYLLLVLLTTENFTYQSGWLAWCFVAAIWAIGAMILIPVGIRWPHVTVRNAGVVAVTFSSLAAILLYDMRLPQGYLLFLNLRFAVCFAPVAVLLVNAFFVNKYKEHPEPGCEPTDGSPTLAKQLYASGFFLLFLLLSAEPYFYCLRTMAGNAATWSAQMSLTVVWSIYATAMLASGFWKKNRPLRFAALGLFGLTAIKLAVVDLAGVGQVYRIISFFVMGVLMVAASYVYHKVEKRLAANATEQLK